MKNILKILGLSIIIIGVSYNLIWYIVVYFAKKETRRLYAKVQTHRRIYVYETYFKALNNAVYIDNLNDSQSLINYYSNISKGLNANLGDITDNKTMPITVKPIYVLSELGSRSNIEEVIDFDTVCWGYLKGYVYKGTVHTQPPPDSLMRKERDYINNQKPAVDVIRTHVSPYGFYCKYCTN